MSSIGTAMDIGIVHDTSNDDDDIQHQCMQTLRHIFRSTFQRYGERVSSSSGSSSSAMRRRERGERRRRRNQQRQQDDEEKDELVAVTSPSLLRDWLEQRNHFHSSIVLNEDGVSVVFLHI